MNIPGVGGDPAEALKKIAAQMQEKAQEAGMGAVTDFTKTLDEVQDMVKEGPSAILDGMKKLFDDFKGKMQEIQDSPGNLAPPGVAACASWYGGVVAGRLKALQEEVMGMIEKIKSLVNDLAAPMKTLGETLKEAMKSLDDTVKKLAGLPNELTDLGGKCQGAADVAKIDTGPMMKATDVKSISSPLQSLADLKGPLKDAIEAVNNGVAGIIDFVTSLPAKVKASFDLPAPICFLQSALMSQAPPAMKTLLEMVDKLGKVDMAPMQKMLGKVSDTICELEPKTIIDPVNKFAASAKDSISGLDTVVKGAKVATGGKFW